MVYVLVFVLTGFSRKHTEISVDEMEILISFNWPLTEDEAEGPIL